MRPLNIIDPPIYSVEEARDSLVKKVAIMRKRGGCRCSHEKRSHGITEKARADGASREQLLYAGLAGLCSQKERDSYAPCAHNRGLFLPGHFVEEINTLSAANIIPSEPWEVWIKDMQDRIMHVDKGYRENATGTDEGAHLSDEELDELQDGIVNDLIVVGEMLIQYIDNHTQQKKLTSWIPQGLRRLMNSVFGKRDNQAERVA